MKRFLADNVLSSIEKGLPILEHPLWHNRTEHEEGTVYWIGAKPDTWLVIADVLYKAGNEARALADAIANQLGMERNE